MRLNKLLLLACFAIPSLGFAQQDKLEVGIKVGAAAGLCDIGGISTAGKPWVLDLQPSQIRWDIGAYMRYRIRKNINISVQLEYIRLQGADSLSKLTDIKDRNLNYQDNLIQGTIRGEWTFYDNPDVGGNYNYTTTFQSYLFVGVGLFSMNPEAMITHNVTLLNGQSYSAGQWVNTQPLQTEGEATYSLIQPVIPMGIGFYYTFNKNWRLGWELCWEKTFTDYIDDVHDRYPTLSKDNPAPANTSLATYMSYGQSQYVPGIGKLVADYENGSPRGNPNNNDAYITTAVNVGFIIHPKAGHARKTFFDKNNYKSRASF
jgi:hypothetical protein